MRRIGLAAFLAFILVLAPVAAETQPQAKVPTIGWLSSGFPPSEAARQQLAFFKRLRELGWVEGHNLLIETRWAEGNPDRLPELAAQLVQLGVSVLVAGDSQVIVAAVHATNTIPIVMTVSGDPVGAGLIKSLAQPGGNVTGLTLMVPELVGKRLQLLKESVPRISRVAVLGESRHYEWPAVAKATQALRLRMRALRVDSPGELAPAFAAAKSERADALLVLPSPLTNRSMHEIVDLAARSRLPAIYGVKEYVEIGGLMAYGWSIPDLSRRAAVYVDKILKGAQPANLPVERPSTFELVINLKTAKALGLTVPPSVLGRADHVIE